MAKLVVIEGLDGSGKATQTQLLGERFEARGISGMTVSFPNYKSNASALVRMYLDGDFGKNPRDISPYAASAFYSVDRYASYMRDAWSAHYRSGGLVLADRYTTSNLIHQCSKMHEVAWPGFRDWLEDFEYVKLGIPKPDLVLFLDVETEVSQKLLERREKRYGGNGNGDIHEDNLEYLLRCRKAARWCVEQMGWKLAVCSQNGAMRPRGEITDELERIIQAEMKL